MHVRNDLGEGKNRVSDRPLEGQIAFDFRTRLPRFVLLLPTTVQARDHEPLPLHRGNPWLSKVRTDPPRLVHAA